MKWTSWADQIPDRWDSRNCFQLIFPDRILLTALSCLLHSVLVLLLLKIKLFLIPQSTKSIYFNYCTVIEELAFSWNFSHQCVCLCLCITVCVSYRYYRGQFHIADYIVALSIISRTIYCRYISWLISIFAGYRLVRQLYWQDINTWYVIYCGTSKQKIENYKLETLKTKN